MKLEPKPGKTKDPSPNLTDYRWGADLVDFGWRGEVAERSLNRKIKEWKAAGEIGPHPNYANSPSVLYTRHFYKHEQWTRSEGRYGERLVLQTRQLSHICADATDFSGAIFANVTFDHVSFKESLFKGAQFFGVRFDHCDLDKADFSGASGKVVSFDGSNPEKANFGEGRTGIEERSPDRNDIKFVGRAKAKYHSL